MTWSVAASVPNTVSANRFRATGADATLTIRFDASGQIPIARKVSYYNRSGSAPEQTEVSF